MRCAIIESRTNMDELSEGTRIGGRRSLQTSAGRNRVHFLRQELEKLHQQAKSNAENLAGGGVSLWPDMDNMRLSREEVWRLLAVCIVLFLFTGTLFYFYHGDHVVKLKNYAQQLETFHSGHPLSQLSDEEFFKQRLLAWHRDFLKLQDAIHRDFDVVWAQTSLWSFMFLLLYIVGIATLLYFLVDNMFTKSRLTPARIKVWLSLLCVMTVWTALVLHLLVSAQWVESATKQAVLSLNEELAVLVERPWDLQLYHSILEYWATRCLPPRSPGVLSVLGLVQVQDLVYYLQYYSLPILTAILAPFIRVLLALKRVYSV